MFEPLASAVLGYFVKRSLDASEPYVRKVFDERLTRLLDVGAADRHLILNSQQLIEFYRNDAPYAVQLGDKEFWLPISVTLAGPIVEEPESQLVAFDFTEEFYKLPSRLDPYANPIREKLKRRKKYSDGHLLRISGQSEQNSKTLITLQSSSFFDLLCTNYSMDHRPPDRSQTLREYLSGASHKLESLDTSALSNGIGVVCMLETSDEQLIVQKRSHDVASRRGTLSSSVSGSVPSTIINKFAKDQKISLVDFAHAAFNESLEELGTEIHSITLLAIVREFIRGGKPEFYFYARTDMTCSQVKESHLSATSRNESYSLVGHELRSDFDNQNEAQRFSFTNRVLKIIEEVQLDANLTLIAGILMVSQFILENRVGTNTGIR